MIAFNSAMSSGNSSGTVMPVSLPKQGQNDPCKGPRESLRRRRCCDLQGLHAPPIQTRKQRLKLCRFQMHHPVLDRGPFEAVILKSLIRHHQPAAVPVDQLQPICALGAEDINRPIKGLLSQMTLHQSSQPVMAFAEVDRITGHKNTDLVGWHDHVAMARAISAIRGAGVAASRRTMTSPLITSSVLENGLGRASATGASASISTGTKSIPSKFGRTSLPCRAIRRQSDTVLGINSYRFATALTVSPSINVSATIRAFSSRGQFRFPSARRGTLARNSLVAPIKKLPTNQRCL